MPVSIPIHAEDGYSLRSSDRPSLRHRLLLLSSLLALAATAHAQLPDKTIAATARIEQALRAQDTPAAMREYQALVAADPQNSRAWTGYGVLLYGSGQASAARDALTRALALDPNSSRAELFLALSQADLHQCAKASPQLEKHFHSEPAGKLQRLAGLTLLQCSTKSADSKSTDSAAALTVATQLRQAYPGDPDVLYESAELYTRLWTNTAEELITSHPDSYRVHQLGAEVAEAQGNLEQAAREYRAALTQNSHLPQMHYRIGQLLLRIGAPDADENAAVEFRAELALNPQSAVSALALAGIERHEQKLAPAEADYTLAARLDPDLVEARVGLAQTHLALHNIDAAQSEAKAVLAEHPDDAQAHYVLMLTYREQSRLPEAATEMAAFQKLQHEYDERFHKKLTALLTGSKDSASSPASSTTP